MATVALLFGSPAKADDAEQAIQAAYAKRYKAAGLRYLYGMRHHRSNDFVALGSNGEKLDLDIQEAMWSELFSRTLNVNWTGQIHGFEYLTDSKVRCEVKDELAAVTRDSRYTSRHRYTISTYSVDVWEFRNDAWEQTRSEIVEQFQQVKKL